MNGVTAVINPALTDGDRLGRSRQDVTVDISSYRRHVVSDLLREVNLRMGINTLCIQLQGSTLTFHLDNAAL